VPARALFGLSVLLGFAAWGFVVARYVWPALRTRARADALQPLLCLHAFRFVGLVFLVPGVVAADLPQSFARPAGYLDLATAILALLALATLRSAVGIALAWLVQIVGTLDLVHNFYEGFRVGLEPGLQGAAYFIPTVLVPLLLITHGLAFRILARRE
jgi:hypothetical protein